MMSFELAGHRNALPAALFGALLLRWVLALVCWAQAPDAQASRATPSPTC